MKYIYLSPAAEEAPFRAENVLCASGGNEDFGHKPGSYDLLEPFEDFFELL